jgi:MerR family transcriptional regulator, light-induced transcriptional regulator
MTTIVDLPEDPKYTIKTVSIQTGIRPITLRAWERRYSLLAPFRSDNRYRLYSERDIAILHWIKNRLDGGLSISSAVREFKDFQKKETWPEAMPVQQQSGPNPHQAKPPASFASQLTQILLRHDETAAMILLGEAHAAFDLTTICLEIIVPCLIEIGEQWHRGEIRIADEHYITTFLRGKLMSLLQAYPNRRNMPYIITATAPSELHEIGSLILSVLLRRDGYRVEYLGSDVPVEDLVDYARFEHPALIILSATTETAALELVHLQEKLSKLHPVPLFGFGGAAFNMKPELRQLISGQFLGETLNEACQMVARLVK